MATRVKVLALTAIVGITGITPIASGASAPNGGGEATRVLPVTAIRSTPARELGLERPMGISWSAPRDQLFVTGRRGAEWRRVRVSPDGEVRGSVRTSSVSRSQATTDDAGVRYVLNGARRSITRTDPGGTVRTIPIRGVAGDLRGLAWNPSDRLVYVASPARDRLWGLDGSGTLRRTYSLRGVGLEGVDAMTFAPSADGTDEPSIVNLYVADGAGEQVVELSLAPLAAAAASETASLIRTINMATMNPPSPDPAGITYLPVSDTLLISDSEVDEMSLYRGATLFEVRRTGALVRGSTTLPWSDEPTGTGHRDSNDALFVSDDDADRIFIDRPGTDGIHGTSDDTVTQINTKAFGNSDAEGCDYDEGTGNVVSIDGVGREVYVIDPGANARFDGVPSTGGDDVVTHFDVGAFGATDPEGIAVDPARGTFLIVDHGSENVYEVDRSGSLLRVIDVRASNQDKAAGMTIAPSTVDGVSPALWIVDRGIDNDNSPNENDGKIYEMSFQSGPIANRAPTVSAGPDRSVTFPNAASLAGSVSDDGLPTGATVTSSWSRVSGPGTATFTDPAAPSTTVTFSDPGTYVLRLSATDTELQASDDVTVTVLGPGDYTQQLAVGVGSDDAEESSTGSVSLTGSDLELVNDGTRGNQTVGIRFTGVAVPPGATIASAAIRFTADEVTTGAVTNTIVGQDVNNAGTFVKSSLNISSRVRTTASVTWDAPAWSTVGASGPAQTTSDLSPVVQEIVDRGGWAQGNAMAFIFTGTGKRTARAFEAGQAPVLDLAYHVGPVANRAPTVSAGPDRSVTFPNAASLAGSVSDDGLPTGATVTSSWSRVSGPGTATFTDPAAPSTTVTFSDPGTYVLRLSATDTELQASDDVTVTTGDTVTTQLAVPVTLDSDDAEETAAGAVDAGSSDLELVLDNSTTGNQTVGIRFAGLQIPPGATIVNAYVQFEVDEASTASVALTIRGQLADDAPTFAETTLNISSRPQTTAFVSWSPPAWPTPQVAGPDQRTPNLATVIQEIVGRGGWSQGQAIALIITGTGKRTAEAVDGTAAPILHVEFTS
jgi:hypothetical protein